jgi:hypothetical protein
MGKPLPLTLLRVINPCHLHDPNGMSLPDDITKTLSKHGGSPCYRPQQIVVPQSLVSRILYLEHYPPAAGHPGAHRMFQTIRKTFYWPLIAEDVYETVRQCDLCARNRISEKVKQTRSSSSPRTVLWSPLPCIF